MYTKLFRDLRKRLLSDNVESRKKILKFLILNFKVSSSYKHYLFLNYKKQMRGFSQLTRRCLITNRKNSYSFLKISRIKFRELICVGFVPGLKKSSW